MVVVCSIEAKVYEQNCMLPYLKQWQARLAVVVVTISLQATINVLTSNAAIVTVCSWVEISMNVYGVEAALL